MFRQTLKKNVLPLALSAAMLGAPAAHAVTATTTVQITFPTVLILYTYDQIALDVTAASLAAALSVTGTSCTAGSYCVQLTGPAPIDWDMTNPVNVDVASGAAALPTLNPVAVNIQNAWGVRSVAPGGLAASVTGPTSLTGPPGSSSIGVTNIATDNTTPTRGMGALNASRTGSIDFDINADNLDTAGDYTGDFVVEVTSP